MKSQKLGKNTSTGAEILNISPNGIWLLVRDREYFLPYERYPWFATANVRQIHDVELLFGKHLHWSALDVDIELESLEHPEKYPMTYRNRT